MAVHTVTQGSAAPFTQTISGFTLNVDQITVVLDGSGYAPWVRQETRGGVTGTAFVYWFDDREVWLPDVVAATAAAIMAPSSPVANIILTPANPGSPIEATPGAGADWTTLVTSNLVASIKYFVLDATDTPRSAGTTIATDGSDQITVHFEEDGDFLRVEDASDSGVFVESGAVTLRAPGAEIGPPVGWAQVVNDQFTGSSLSTEYWRHQSYGSWQQPSSSMWYDYNNHTRVEGGECVTSVDWSSAFNVFAGSGQQQGTQTTDPNAYGYHPGYLDFHVRFRARLDPLHAPGIGWFFLMWPSHDGWTSEIDILETPTDSDGNHTIAMATMHWNPSGDGGGMHRDASLYHHQESAFINGIDLSEWHVWECRRTIDGQGRATITVWIDGEQMDQPAGWVNNPNLAERMGMGFSGFALNGGWYDASGGWGGGTPAVQNVAAHISEVELWVPGEYVPPTEHLLEAAFTGSVTLNIALNAPGDQPPAPIGRNFTYTPGDGYDVITAFVVGSDRITINTIDGYVPHVMANTRDGQTGTDFVYWFGANIIWLPGVIGANAATIQGPQLPPTEITLEFSAPITLTGRPNMTGTAAPAPTGRVWVVEPGDDFITIPDFVVGVDRLQAQNTGDYVPWVQPATVNGVSGTNYTYWFGSNIVWLPGVSGVTVQQLERQAPVTPTLQVRFDIGVTATTTLDAENDATGAPLAVTFRASMGAGVTLESPNLGPVKLHLLVRGQSNSIFLMESSGGWDGYNRLRSEVQRLLGFDGVTSSVEIVYERFDSNTATSVGGTALTRDWLARSGSGWTSLALHNALLAKVASIAEKSEPAAVIWLHSEDDSRLNVSTDDWVSAVRYDAQRVRETWGKTAAQLPYIFVEAHPYWAPDEGHQAIKRGMETLAGDTSFAAVIGARATDLNLSRDNTDGDPNTTDFGGSHFDDGDVLQTVDRLARSVAAWYRGLARIGAPVALDGLQFDWKGPKVVGVEPTTPNTVRLSFEWQGSQGLLALSSAAAAGVGWSMRDGATVLNATGAALAGGGAQLDLTFGASIPTNGRLFYGWGYGRLVGSDGRGRGNAAYDSRGLPVWASAYGQGLGGAPPAEPPEGGRVFAFTPGDGSATISDFVVGTDRIIITPVDSYEAWVAETNRDGVDGTEFTYWFGDNIIWLPGILGVTAAQLQTASGGTPPDPVHMEFSASIGVTMAPTLTSFMALRPQPATAGVTMSAALIDGGPESLVLMRVTAPVSLTGLVTLSSDIRMQVAFSIGMTGNVLALSYPENTWAEADAPCAPTWAPVTPCGPE